MLQGKQQVRPAKHFSNEVKSRREESQSGSIAEVAEPRRLTTTRQLTKAPARERSRKPRKSKRTKAWSAGKVGFASAVYSYTKVQPKRDCKFHEHRADRTRKTPP